jgi:type I restriction enzyme M protein
MIGQFFTPEIVSQTMFRMVGVRSTQRVIDPSCGDGSFLRTAPDGLKLFGCEVDPKYAAMSNPILPEGHFTHGDALTALVDLWGTFDLAIGNPPFRAQASLEKRSEVLRGYDLGAGRPSQCLEVLFLELFMKLVKVNGRIAVILPDGPFSNKPFKYVRDWLLCRAHVEAIISLPRGIFSKTTAKTNILIAKKLPLSAQPYREPTGLFACEALSDLMPARLAIWKKKDSRWKSVVLADQEDWRPESLSENEDKTISTVRLGDLFRLRTGYAAYSTKRELLESGGADRTILIRAKNISPEGGLRLQQDCAFIRRSGEMYCQDSMVKPGEILFVRVGAGCYGRTALVSEGIEAQADDWIHVLTPIVKVDSEGIFDWFNSDSGRAAVRRLAKGVGTLSVSKASLAELRLPAHFQLSNDLVLDGSVVTSIIKDRMKRPKKAA